MPPVSPGTSRFALGLPGAMPTCWTDSFGPNNPLTFISLDASQMLGCGANDMLEGMTPRITTEPGKRAGQPCVRGLRITVWDVLSWLAAGMTEQQILDDYPELAPDDFRALYEFAARMGRRVAL